MYFPEDPGGGPPNLELLGEDGQPVTREWFAPVEKEETSSLSWWDILTHWDAIEGDMHHFFSVDMADPVVKQQRDWRWFTVRVKWLFGVDSALARALRPPPTVGETDPHGDA